MDAFIELENEIMEPEKLVEKIRKMATAFENCFHNFPSPPIRFGPSPSGKYTRLSFL